MGIMPLESILYLYFLGVFTELWRVIINFGMSVCQSVLCLSAHMEQLSSHWMDFQKSVKKIVVWCLTRITGTWYMKTYVNLW